MARHTIGSLKKTLGIQGEHKLYVHPTFGDDSSASERGVGTFKSIQAAIDYAKEKIHERHRVQIYIDNKIEQWPWIETSWEDDYIVLNRKNTELIGEFEEEQVFLYMPLYIGNLTYDAFKTWYEAGGVSWTFTPATNSYSYTGQNTLGLDTVAWTWQNDASDLDIKIKNLRILTKELLVFNSAADGAGDAGMSDIAFEDCMLSPALDHQHWFYGINSVVFKNCLMISKANQYATVFENCGFIEFGNSTTAALDSNNRLLCVSTDASSYAGLGISANAGFLRQGCDLSLSGLILSNQTATSKPISNATSSFKATSLALYGKIRTDDDLDGTLSQFPSSVRLAGDLVVDDIDSVRMTDLNCQDLTLATGGTLSVIGGQVEGNLSMDAGTLTLTDITIVGNIDLDGGTLTLNNCHVKGNIDVAAGASININGGQILSAPTGTGTVNVVVPVDLNTL